MSAEIKTVVKQRGRYVNEHFDMKLRGTDRVVHCVINHTRHMVKIGEAVFTKEGFNQLLRMGPERARATIAVCEGIELGTPQEGAPPIETSLLSELEKKAMSSQKKIMASASAHALVEYADEGD